MRLIDADVAIEKFNRYGRPYDKWETVGIIELIKYDISTADAEPVRHGRWIKRGKIYFVPNVTKKVGIHGQEPADIATTAQVVVLRWI